jgi:SAM-dependent methyltransferase
VPETRVESGSGEMTATCVLSAPYLPGLTVAQYVDVVRREFSRLAVALCFDRPGAEAAVAELTGQVNEFEDEEGDGRGGSYRLAQCNLMVRATGIRTLFRLAAGVAEVTDIPRDWWVLDLLGGDGLLARVLQRIAPQIRTPIVTSDMAGAMVEAALRKGLPAIRQKAQFLFLRERTMDAVILAYGTHHIAPGERIATCREAARVLRPGGRLVVHDFEESSPVAAWFAEVVHRYARAGHDYRHFTAAEMAHCVQAADLRLVGTRRVYDPLIVPGASPDDACDRVVDYLVNMYGLAGLTEDASPAEVRDKVWKLASSYFRYTRDAGPDESDGWKRVPVIYFNGVNWVAEVPRVALVTVGEKEGALCVESSPSCPAQT